MEALIVSNVFSLLSSAVSRQLRYLKPPGGDVAAVAEAWDALRGRREDVSVRLQIAEAEGESCKREVSIWLEKVREIEAKAKKVTDRYAKTRCLGGFSLSCWSINTKSGELLRDVERLTDQGQFESVALRMPPEAVQELPIRSTQFGLQSYLEEVGLYLADDRADIVAIWGMGGVGKTTLLQNINNELLPGGRLKGEFDHVIWALASRDYNLEALQKRIARTLGMALSDDGDVETRASAITAFLRRKNFLLLLDDLWEHVDLEMVGIPAPRRSSQLKRKVIFTTRSEKVCSDMEAKGKITVKCLDTGDAWRLFKDKVGEVLSSDPRLRHLAEQVVKECDGLPLALITIGRAMATKKTRSEWEIAIELLQQSRLHEIPDKDDSQRIQTIYKKLKISYDSLQDDTARQCFLTCALWPEDYPIDKLELIQSWMGLGLLDETLSDTIDKAYWKGHSLIRSLEAACLLEPVLDSENKVKMHDVIRDMALWIANGEGTNMNEWIVKAGAGLTEVPENVEGWKGARRTSFMSNGLTELAGAPNSPLLSSLMLQKNRRLRRIHRHFFQFMAALTFLDLSSTNIHELPEKIGELPQLLYLNLSDTPISSLPDAFRGLKNLKYLLLRNTSNLKEIPHGLISSLSKLLVLDLFGSGYADWETVDSCSSNHDVDKASKTPQDSHFKQKRASFEEFRQLTQGLKFLGVTIETFEALDQLSDIRQVSTRGLGIIGWVGAESLRQLVALLRRPSISHKLQVLRVENCGTSGTLTIGRTEDKPGESSRSAGAWSLPKLEVLELRNLMKLREIIWMGVEPRSYLPMIRELKISDCDKLEDVCWVLDLEYLEHLELSNCKCMKQVIHNDCEKPITHNDCGKEVSGEENKQGPFCGLRTLVLERLPLLHSICNHAYDFPLLKSLEVKECQMLGELPFSAEIIRNKSLVIRGEEDWWNNLVLKGELGNMKHLLRFNKF